MDKWLTDLTIDELRAKILPKPHRPFEINGIPVFMNMDDSLLPGEAFKKHPEKPVEASNFGRIRFNGKILLQRPDEKQSAPYGYLWVEIPDVSKYQLVYRLVAETWCERPNSDYNTVHHISNNGTDNRPENLLWVTPEQHAEIHPWLKNRQSRKPGEQIEERMKSYITYIHEKLLIRYLKFLFEQHLFTGVNEVLLKVHSIRQINLGDYANNTDQTVVGKVNMDPIKGFIFIELTEDLYEPILYYACNGLPKSYKKGCNAAKEITDIDIIIMEGIMVRILGYLRDSFAIMLDLRPILDQIETSLNDVYCYFVEDVKNMTGILVEIIVYFDNLSGKLNMFYPKSTLKQLLEIREKNEKYKEF
jgi:flagellar motor switch protein FliM